MGYWVRVEHHICNVMSLTGFFIFGKWPEKIIIESTIPISVLPKILRNLGCVFLCCESGNNGIYGFKILRIRCLKSHFGRICLCRSDSYCCRTDKARLVLQSTMFLSRSPRNTRLNTRYNNSILYSFSLLCASSHLIINLLSGSQIGCQSRLEVHQFRRGLLVLAY